MVSRLKDSLQTIIEALVEDKSEVKIEEIESGKDIRFEVRVASRRYGQSNWKRR